MVMHSADSLCNLSWNILSVALGMEQWTTNRDCTVKGTKTPHNLKIECYNILYVFLCFNQNNK
jgi:hypothetical protein